MSSSRTSEDIKPNWNVAIQGDYTTDQIEFSEIYAEPCLSARFTSNYNATLALPPGREPRQVDTYIIGDVATIIGYISNKPWKFIINIHVLLLCRWLALERKFELKRVIFYQHRSRGFKSPAAGKIWTVNESPVGYFRFIDNSLFIVTDLMKFSLSQIRNIPKV